jgi:galactokinase
MSPATPHPRLRDLFEQRFGRPCAAVARAPGRVNLIGEHTDYNEGFVLPMALEQCTWVAAGPRDDATLRAVTLDLGEERTWAVDGWEAGPLPAWTSYVAGVAALLCLRGALRHGADVLIRSEVPVGGGLSSSAALEVATALALATLARFSVAPVALADLCRAAEHEFAGVPCGIMDQYVSVLARAECALLLDCRRRTWEHIPLPLGEHVVIVVNSGVRHELAASEYARRQQECRHAVEFFRRLDRAVLALRDVTEALLRRHAAELEGRSAARARHVITENARTLAAAEALRRGDLAEFGRLMTASHVSLRDDYQVSCPELDQLVDIVSAIPGVLGARMTGGGFGGCIVALAPRASVPQIESAIRTQYPGQATILPTQPGPGATCALVGPVSNRPSQ